MPLSTCGRLIKNDYSSKLANGEEKILKAGKAVHKIFMVLIITCMEVKLKHVSIKYVVRIHKRLL